MKYLLVFQVLYSLASEPNGHWEFNQFFWAQSYIECEMLAVVENARVFQARLLDIESRTFIIKTQYECVDVYKPITNEAIKKRYHLSWLK